MKLILETKKENKEARINELNKFKHYYKNYLYSSNFNNNPFNCHYDECKEINCIKCIEKEINKKLEQLNKDGYIYF